MTVITAVLNHKGGVAKTTTAISLAAALADRFKRVLLVDLDSQASATYSLGIEDLRPSIAGALLAGADVWRAIRKTEAGFDLITGSPELADFDVLKGNEADRLKRALAPVTGEYEFIFLDCPPSLSAITRNALVAADRYLVPVTPHYLSLRGLASLFTAIRQLHQEITVNAELLGIALTMVDRRAKVAGELIDALRERYGELVFQAEIPLTTRIAEAPSYGNTIFQYDNRSKGAEAYQLLAGEFLTRLGEKKK